MTTKLYPTSAVHDSSVKLIPAPGNETIDTQWVSTSEWRSNVLTRHDIQEMPCGHRVPHFDVPYNRFQVVSNSHFHCQDRGSRSYSISRARSSRSSLLKKSLAIWRGGAEVLHQRVNSMSFNHSFSVNFLILNSLFQNQFDTKFVFLKLVW